MDVKTTTFFPVKGAWEIKTSIFTIFPNLFSLPCHFPNVKHIIAFFTFFIRNPDTLYNGTKLRGIVVKRAACLPAKSAGFPIKRHLAQPLSQSNMLNLVPLGIVTEMFFFLIILAEFPIEWYLNSFVGD